MFNVGALVRRYDAGRIVRRLDDIGDATRLFDMLGEGRVRLRCDVIGLYVGPEPLNGDWAFASHVERNRSVFLVEGELIIDYTADWRRM